MRKSFLTSYVFGAEAIIQHWLWKTLKTATKSFGPLLIVFADDYDATAACGTLAWERIFTAFPCSGTAITHQLIVSGFQQCRSLKGDTTEEFTKYMALLNESLPGFYCQAAGDLRDLRTRCTHGPPSIWVVSP